MSIRTPLNYLAGAGILLTIVAGGAYYASQAPTASAATAATETPLTVYWSDGDSGRLSDGTKFRLHGIDSPETGSMKQRGGAKCESERALGFEAKEAALELTRGKQVTISEMRGTDRYERTVVRLELDGKDLAALLVAGGTHRTWDYDGREKKPDWCAGAAS
ncbi:MAG: nuclease [Hyphomonas sp.]|uniref:thermonuclease family protein n=1 Tax=Hyphomonas sp. TaxID=87 RepID=UPI0025BBA634|nr:thermonuclease family protein [Hyphomonas sp.]MBA4338044.1 nuclease [Hyphomonas sp.]